MAIQLTNIIETVMNPNGRFRTLGGIYPVLTQGGEPSMEISELNVRFDVVWNGVPHTLKCYPRPDAERTRRLREISVYTERIACPHLTPHIFLENEMLVFDDTDTPVYTDVVLHRKPAGERLDRYLARLASSGGRGAIGELTAGLSAIADWLAANEFSHGNLCAGNIYVSGSNLVLVNYSRASRSRSDDDLPSLGALAAAVYVTACQPELYEGMIRDRTLKTKGLARLAYVLADIMEGSGADELNGLLTILTAGKDGGDICTALHGLSSAPVRSYPALEAIVANLRRNSADPSRSADGKYTFIGRMCDMVMRVFDGSRWFYIDHRGDKAFTGDFASAEDFCEGRAAVETKEGYGLIDLAGNFVIEPRYDDIEWDGNVAIVTMEGQSGLYSREGEPLTGLIYDQVLPASEGMFPVRKNGKYGYIRRDGVMAIRPRFDDAFGFRDGFARVSNGDSHFLIDRQGCVIDKIRRKSSTAGK